MTYFVTSYGFDADGHPAPAAIDTPANGVFNLEDALSHACALLKQSVPNVAIKDGNGVSISGDELIACCRGEKTLTPELRAIPT